MTLTRKMTFQLVPTELTEHILTFCHVRDVARVAQTCKQLHMVVYESSDQYLWRELFLLYPFDDLRKCVPCVSVEDLDDSQVDWRGELQRRVFAETVALADPNASCPEELQAALSTLISVVRTALPHQPLTPGQIVVPPSENITWLRNVLQHSPVIRCRTLGSADSAEQQLSCELRVYLSLTLDEGKPETNVHLQDLRSNSRCAVYNLENYTMKNFWGPYHCPCAAKEPLASGRKPIGVNWSHVEHIMNVVVMNLRELEGTPYSLTRPQLGLEPTRAYSAPGTAELRTNGSKDWAGLEGLWRRFVCFMDYRCVDMSLEMKPSLTTLVAESCLVRSLSLLITSPGTAILTPIMLCTFSLQCKSYFLIYTAEVSPLVS